jgi:hypothetical protein
LSCIDASPRSNVAISSFERIAPRVVSSPAAIASNWRSAACSGSMIARRNVRQLKNATVRPISTLPMLALNKP